MKNQFVTYEIALKLKELRFDEPCFGGYYHEDKEINHDLFIGYNMFDGEEFNREYFILAPLWQQVFDWFREKYNIYIKISYKGKYWYEYKKGYGGYINDFSHIVSSYEEAREQAILKAIELIKKEIKTKI